MILHNRYRDYGFSNLLFDVSGSSEVSKAAENPAGKTMPLHGQGSDFPQA